MLMLMQVRMPHKEFNSAVRDRTAGRRLNQILEEIQPKSVYFTEIRGQRTAVLIVEVENASKIPSLAEPWFLCFNADVEFHPVMTPEDLARSGLDELGKKWS